MLLKSVFSISVLVSFLGILTSCSLTADYKKILADYKRTVKFQVLSVDILTEVEINCEQKKSRAVISGFPIKTMDGIETVSQNWGEIDKVFEHATQELFNNYKKEFAEKPLMIAEVKRQAFDYQKAIEAEYFKVCKKF
jgi:hypothetical protein